MRETLAGLVAQLVADPRLAPTSAAGVQGIVALCGAALLIVLSQLPLLLGLPPRGGRQPVRNVALHLSQRLRGAAGAWQANAR